MESPPDQTARQIIRAFYERMTPLVRGLNERRESGAGHSWGHRQLVHQAVLLDLCAGLEFQTEPLGAEQLCEHAYRILTAWHIEHLAGPGKLDYLGKLLRLDADYLYLAHFVDDLLHHRRRGLDSMNRDDRETLAEALSSLYRVQGKTGKGKGKGKRPRKSPPKRGLRTQYLAIQEELKHPTPENEELTVPDPAFVTDEFSFHLLKTTRRECGVLPDPDNDRRTWESKLSRQVLRNVVIRRKPSGEEITGLAKVLVYHFPWIRLKWSRSRRGFDGLGFRPDYEDNYTSQYFDDALWEGLSIAYVGRKYAEAAAKILAAKYSMGEKTVGDYASEALDPITINDIDSRRNWSHVTGIAPSDIKHLAVTPCPFGKRA